MKTYKIITEFRRDFLALDYLHSKMRVDDLERWAHTWCQDKDLPKHLYDSFFRLAYAYVEKHIYEKELYSDLKKIKILFCG